MIEVDRFYSLGEIVRENAIPGVDSIPKAARLVNNPLLKSILKPKIVKRGIRGLQYRVKGENITSYINYVEKNKGDKKAK